MARRYADTVFLLHLPPTLDQPLTKVNQFIMVSLTPMTAEMNAGLSNIDTTLD